MAAPGITPITILTGFGYLGSGKSTLSNHWLRHYAIADGAIVVNKFGELASRKGMCKGSIPYKR